MRVNEIRMFGVQRGRDGEINFAILCNGRTHFVCRGRLDVPHPAYYENRLCDGEVCQGADSESVNTSLLSSVSQGRLGLKAHVPLGMVLVAKHYPEYSQPYMRSFGGGEMVTPKQLEAATLLADGEGLTYVRSTTVYYVRNVEGTPEEHRAGRQGRKRTKKKIAKLRRGERKSEVTHEVSYLNERLIELMQLHRTPEVLEEIENVKELLRLASSLSVEASIEAAEGNEEIARELANSRAREIGAELQQTRERLVFEKTAREEARKELKDRYDN